jgi:hypothetical protein
MTADAQSAVSADGSPEPVVSTGERSADAERSGDPVSGQLSYLRPAEGGSPNGNGALSRTRPTRRPADERAAEAAAAEAADEPSVEEPSAGAGAVDGQATGEDSLDDDAVDRLAAEEAEEYAAEEAAEEAAEYAAEGAHEAVAEHADEEARDELSVGDVTPESERVASATTDVTGTRPDEVEADSAQAGSAEGHGAGGGMDESGWEAGDGLVPPDVVEAEVAQQLGAVVGGDSDADPAEFAAAAVLDVLRASGWADAAEAAELRSEASRLRELLAEVIRDHRAREASLAGFENQQLHWLVPLLRAAHGVAFGSLGAKVALRTAVQEVPPHVLASAGLRIDYGVEPDHGSDYEDER